MSGAESRRGRSRPSGASPRGVAAEGGGGGSPHPGGPHCAPRVPAGGWRGCGAGEGRGGVRLLAPPSRAGNLCLPWGAGSQSRLLAAVARSPARGMTPPPPGCAALGARRARACDPPPARSELPQSRLQLLLLLLLLLLGAAASAQGHPKSGPRISTVWRGRWRARGRRGAGIRGCSCCCCGVCARVCGFPPRVGPPTQAGGECACPWHAGAAGWLALALQRGAG